MADDKDDANGVSKLGDDRHSSVEGEAGWELRALRSSVRGRGMVWRGGWAGGVAGGERGAEQAEPLRVFVLPRVECGDMVCVEVAVGLEPASAGEEMVAGRGIREEEIGRRGTCA
jgi:hypothetical protein